MLYDEIISHLLKSSKFSLEQKIQRSSKLVLSIDNFIAYGFPYNDSLKKLFDQLDQVAPNQFFGIPDQSYYLNMKDVDFIKISKEKKVRIYLKNKKIYGFNFSDIAKKEFHLDLTLSEFLEFLEKSPISFLKFDDKLGSLKYLVNIDNIAYAKIIVNKDFKFVNPKNGNLMSNQYSLITFKGTVPTTLEYGSSLERVMPFSDLLNNYYKNKVIKEIL